MTQEEKAKAYDEALKYAKMYYKENKDYNAGFLPIIFPELAESEDERIRKHIVKFIDEQYPTHGNLKEEKDKMLAYLERQKEQKSAEFTHHETNESLEEAVTHQMEDDGDVDDFVRRGIDDIALKYAELGAKWQKEQKPAKWEDYKDKVNVPYCSSEPEWSEEDEKMLRTIISDGSRGVELDSKQISWLKSLRPQPHWKPSEEQDLIIINKKDWEAQEKFLKNKDFGKPLQQEQDYSGLSDLERAIHRGFLCAGVENVPVAIIKETAKEVLVYAKEQLLSYANESNPAIEAMADLERTFSCNPDKLPIWLKNELAKKHLEGYTLGKEDAMRDMNDFIKSHFNTQSGTSTSKAEG